LAMAMSLVSTRGLVHNGQVLQQLLLAKVGLWVILQHFLHIQAAPGH